jgi:hypothetical protein
MLTKKLIIPLVLLLIVHKAQAQYDTKFWSYTVKMGSTQFYGDIAPASGFLNPLSLFSKQGFYIGGSLDRALNRYVSLHVDLDGATLRSKSTISYNARLEAAILQSTFSASVDLMHVINPDLSARRQKIHVEPYIGIGFSAFKAEVFDLNTDILIRYASACCTKVALPLGLMVKYDLSPQFAVGVNLKVSSINTDILDATNGSISNLAQPRGKVYDLFDQSNKSARDKWGSFAITSTFKLNN